MKVKKMWIFTRPEYEVEGVAQFEGVKSHKVLYAKKGEHLCRVKKFVEQWEKDETERLRIEMKKWQKKIEKRKEEALRSSIGIARVSTWSSCWSDGRNPTESQYQVFMVERSPDKRMFKSDSGTWWPIIGPGDRRAGMLGWEKVFKPQLAKY